MDRGAIFVDAGYVFAEGAKLITGQKVPRGQLLLEYDALLPLLHRVLGSLTNLPLLRVYWYDGASSGPSAAHVALAYRPDLKLRLGGVDATGQHGVDQLLARDLTELARNRAMADALLLSGDADLLPAVELAQDHGTRVHLLGIPPARDNQAAGLVQAADTRRELSDTEVRSFLSKRV